MPLIKKQDIDLDKIELWGYTKAKQNDERGFCVDIYEYYIISRYHTLLSVALGFMMALLLF